MEMLDDLNAEQFSEWIIEGELTDTPGGDYWLPKLRLHSKSS